MREQRRGKFVKERWVAGTVGDDDLDGVLADEEPDEEFLMGAEEYDGRDGWYQHGDEPGSW
jgi:hypothetical protein